MPLQQVLDKLLKERKLNWNYNAQQKTIEVVAEQPASSSNNTNNVAPGSNTGITVSGKVTNTTGGALSGAYVLLKGTNKGVVTGENGEFSITNVPVNGTLVFSFAGYDREEVMVNGQTNLAINLKTSVTELNDVTVSVNTGYQQINKEQFVGSIAKLDSALYSRRNGVNILDRLDGTVPGVVFDRKGGTAPIQIRGISTLGVRAGGSLPAFDPLIIVDNFPYYGDINSLNQNDVQDITVLKDAVAASIWGTRAGNGVIVITTKKGKYNQPFRITISSTVSIQPKPDLFYYPQMNASDFIDAEQFLFSKGKYDGDGSFTSANKPIVSPVVEILKKQRDGVITPAEASSQIEALRKLDVRNDYGKYVFRNAISQQHYLNFNGGNNLFNYSFSAGFNNVGSSYQQTSSDKQFTINSINIFRPLKNLEFEFGINLSKNTARGAGISYPINPGGGKGSLYPYAQLVDINGNHLAIPKDYRLAYIDTVGSGKLLDWHYRPLDELGNTDNVTNSKMVRINISMAYRFTSWLKADIRYQYTTQTSSVRNYQNSQSYSTRNLINLFTNLAATTPNLRNPIPIGGILDVNNSELNSQNARAQIIFNKSYNGIHEINSFIAGDISENNSSSNGNRFYGYNDAILTYSTGLDYSTSFPVYGKLIASTAKIQQSNSLSSGAINRFVSLSGNATYTYNHKYIFYISGRRDGANVFGANINNRWKPLWSTGISWDLAKENFYHVAWLPYLRIRSSYGYMGNVDNARSALPTIAYNSVTPSTTNLQGAVIGNAPNPDLKWEEVRTFNLGVDFSLFNNRVSGGIEYFIKQSKDLISNIPFDATTGVPSFVVNAANLKGRGFDIQLKTKNLVGVVKWETGFGFSYNKTIVSKYSNGGYKTSVFTIYGINPNEGQIAWGVYSYKWAGLDPANGDPRGYLNGQISKNYTSLLNDSIKNQVLSGSSIPLYTGNVFNTVSWKNFNLSANITYRLNYYFRKPAINYTNLFNSWISNTDYSNRWLKSGDEVFTSVPSMLYPANSNRDLFYEKSEVNVLKGDNIRLQDIRLSYNWQNRAFTHFPIKSIQLFGYINNLNIILWRANKSNLDPDFTGGSSGIILPVPRVYTIGANINL
jgi:TonB-linked SusC/RagA family outer membrane protein